MISWDSNCLFESMRICKTHYFFSNVQDMGYLEIICSEIERRKESFLKECETLLPTLNDEFGLEVTIEKIRSELDSFLKNKCPISSEGIGHIKDDVRKEIIALKGIKIGEGDFEIICHSRIKKPTVVTHDENLFSLLINYTKTIFLIEFIMENKENLSDVKGGCLKYLWYGCLKRYDLDLKGLRNHFGSIAGNNLHLRRLQIFDFLDEMLPLQNKTIIPSEF